jgi:hypothetical protein
MLEEEGKGVEGSGLAVCRYMGWDGCVRGFVLSIGARKCNAYEGIRRLCAVGCGWLGGCDGDEFDRV